MQRSYPKKINEFIDYPATILRNGNYQLMRAYDFPALTFHHARCSGKIAAMFGVYF